MKKPCSVATCQRPHYAKTFCRVHYKRNLKHGDVRADEPLGSYEKACVLRRAEKAIGVKRGPYSEAHRLAISKAKKGKTNGLVGSTKSLETRAKISLSQAGEKSRKWKGEDVGYVALHDRVRKTIGAKCSHCQSTTNIQAALRTDALGPIKNGKVGKSTMKYSTNPSDYVALCRPCHRVYDGLNWG